MPGADIVTDSFRKPPGNPAEAARGNAGNPAQGYTSRDGGNLVPTLNLGVIRLLRGASSVI